MSDSIRVLIADDHAVLREGLRSFLELQDGIEIVGDAADGAEAVELAEQLRPAVVLMDLVMPKLDGVEAMRELRERVPDTRVIILTSYIDDERLLPAIRAGAAGYLLKNAEPQELARAIRAAHAGEALIDPTVAARLVERLADERGDDSYENLTAREREVLDLIARGFSNKRNRGEDCEDARRQPPGEARGNRPHAGRGVRDAPRPTRVLGPIPDGVWVPAGRTVRTCLLESSPERREDSVSRSAGHSSNAAGTSSSTHAGATSSSASGQGPASSRSPGTSPIPSIGSHSSMPPATRST